MASFTTPTGHTLYVDDDLASSFQIPQQQIAPLLPPNPITGIEVAPPPMEAPPVEAPANPFGLAPPTDPQSPNPAPSPAAPIVTPGASPPPPQSQAGPAPSATIESPKPLDLNAPATFDNSEQTGRQALVDEQRADQVASDVAVEKADEAKVLREQAFAREEALRQKREQERVAEAQDIVKKQADVEKATDIWAKYKIDEGRRWNNLGTGRKVAAGIAVALSALGDALQKKSGPNMALSIIHDAIKDDVNAQLREREGLKEIAAARKGSVDEYLKATGRKEDAFALKMNEELKRTASQIEVAAAKYAAPEQKARALAAAAELKGRAALYTGGVAKSQYDRQQQEKELAESRRHARVMEGQGARGLELQKQGLDIQRDRIAAEREAEAAKLAAKGMQDQAKLVLEQGVGTLKNPKGAPVLAGDKETRAKLENKMYVAGEINDVINEVLEIRDRVGGETGVFNSDDRQKLQVLQNRLAILAKDGTEGLSSENDMKIIANAIGAADVASLRARAAGLEEGKERVMSALNREIRVKTDYTGDAITFPNRFAKTPQQTAEEKKYTETIKKPAVSRDVAFDQAFKIAKERVLARGVKPGADGKFDPDTAVAMVREADAAAAAYKDITPNQSQELKRIGMIAMTPGAAGDAAFKKLQTAARDGETLAIRNAAAAQIQQINLSPNTARRGTQINVSPADQLQQSAGDMVGALGGAQ